MKKVIALTTALIMLLVCFTGCMYSEDTLVINKDGSGHSVSVVRFEKAIVDEIGTSMDMTPEDMGIEGSVVKTIDGVEYYVVEESMDFATLDELKKGLEESGYENVYASEDGISYVFSSGVTKEDVEMMEEMGFDLGESMSAKLTITMPQEIVMTTGTLSEDKLGAEFYYEGKDFYKTQAVVVSLKEETTRPVISGAKHKKTYNSARTITAKDFSGIKKVQYKFKKPSAKKYGSYYKFNLTRTFTKNGTYTVCAYDYYGNKATRVFTIKDTKKPVVSGVSNKKTYSSERFLEFTDNCEVKSVELFIDGKEYEITEEDIFNGIYVGDSGEYKVIVKDVNGNSRTVRFTMK